jgi:hypothetical protein
MQSTKVPPPTTNNPKSNDFDKNNNNNNNNNESIGINKNYVSSIRGILRMSLIVCIIFYYQKQHIILIFKIALMAGWISAIAVQKNLTYINMLTDIKQTREAYIVIAVIADAISIIIFALLLINFDNIKPINKINFGFIVRKREIVNIG